MASWVDESLYDDYRQSLRADQVLYDQTSEHQRVQVIENPRFGRVLVLDDVVQTTTADEFIYHEMITHTPILAHGNVKRALIIGGGDGGVAREALRHPGIEQVTMIEIDGDVVDFSKEYLPTISAGAFDNPRLDLRIADGAKFVAESEEAFDVIIVDSTDPIGPGAVLFTPEFYANCKARLTPGGVLVTQNGVPFMQGDELTGTMKAFKGLFADYWAYMACVPTYACGPMALGWGTDDSGLRRMTPEYIESRYAAAGLQTRYYNPRVHAGAFLLPSYIEALIP